jgi:hypothetical protein
MLMQRVHVITCFKCGDSMPLPRQSLLGKFEHPHCQPSDIWPISHLCSECEHLSVHSAEEIHLLGVEVPVQSLTAYKLVCYEFGTAPAGTKMQVFSQLAPTYQREQALAESIRIAGHLPGSPRLIQHFVIEYE